MQNRPPTEKSTPPIRRPATSARAPLGLARPGLAVKLPGCRDLARRTCIDSSYPARIIRLTTADVAARGPFSARFTWQPRHWGEGRPPWKTKMPISVAMIALSSQLPIAVSDGSRCSTLRGTASSTSPRRLDFLTLNQFRRACEMSRGRGNSLAGNGRSFRRRARLTASRRYPSGGRRVMSACMCACR